MAQKISEAILSAFSNYDSPLPGTPSGKMIIETLSSGLINHSYKVTAYRKPPFFLQKINKQVFRDPRAVQKNYLEIWQYATLEFSDITVPEPMYCDKNATLFLDDKGDYWRAFEFIEGTRTFPVAKTVAQARSTAKTFATFTATFDGFNVDLLKPVIPGFHDLSLRYKQFESSLDSELYERIGNATPLITSLKQRERYRHFYDIIVESPNEFPLRVMHHDAKISNVLFSEKNGRVVCVVDLDTVMPGYFFSDLGDMIRSMACNKDENSTDFAKLRIRKSFYKGIIEGYMAGMRKNFTSAEKKYIHYAGVIMVYMQALRFVTDYLNGDIYYQIKYPRQNFDRAQNQLTLLERLEDFLKAEYRVKY